MLNTLYLASTITGFISISVFVSLLAIPIGIASSVIELTIFVITSGVKRYKSIINKKKKKNDKTLLLENLN